jgi:biopolymer transport protein ExbB/TolQ
MSQLAVLIDYLLYGLVMLSVSLIVFKVIDLWLPSLIGRDEENRLGATHEDLLEGVEQLEEGLTLLAVIASAAPFIGLSGTVMHIIEAMRAMGNASADIGLITGPISTALNATLIGLASAIPAAVAHALFQRKIQVAYNRRLRELGIIQS